MRILRASCSASIAAPPSRRTCLWDDRAARRPRQASDRHARAARVNDNGPFLREEIEIVVALSVCVHRPCGAKLASPPHGGRLVRIGEPAKTAP